MCRAATPTSPGRRCNKHNAYGVRMTNAMARQQYTKRRLENPNLTEKQEEKLLDVLETTTDEISALRDARTALGDGLTPHTMNVTPATENVLNALETAGLKAYIVGGSVRDNMLGGYTPKDIDIEVYGGTAQDVEEALKPLGRVDAVGASFGVLKLTIGSEDFDVSLPRLDSKTGDGHKDFEVKVDPNLSLEEATARRDFTINALMYSHSLGYVIDKHGGLKDMRDHKLRHVSDAFDEDPLRVLRGVQMASRFNFDLHEDTIEKAKTLKNQYGTLATERVQIEFQKLYEKGLYPDKALKLLKATTWDENLPGLSEANTPELQAQAGNLQQVFKQYDIPASQRPLLLGALIAKSIEPKQRLNFLKQTMVGDTVKTAAHRLSETTPPEHATDASLRTWAHNIPRNVTIRDWVYLETATGDKSKAARVFKQAQKLGVLDKAEPDKLRGDDVSALFPDRAPGRWIAEALNQARTAQYRDEFRDRDSALVWAKKNLK